MKAGKIKRLLQYYGHLQVSNTERKRLTLNTSEVIAAVASWQHVMQADFQPLCNIHHGKVGKCDGIIGPATMETFTVPRCGYPDIQPLGEEEAGSGSVVENCDPDYPGEHVWKIHLNRSNMPAHFDADIDRSFELVFAAYLDIGLRYIFVDDPREANTLVTFERLNGSTIGLAIVPTRFSCGMSIWIKLDTNYNPRDVKNKLPTLIAHELFHNKGGRHGPSGITAPSIQTLVFTRTAWRGDFAFPQLKRWFGGIPLQPTTPTPPPAPPTPGGFSLSGQLRLRDEAGNFVQSWTPEPTQPPTLG